ncbi:MAG: OprO/OprP family phosphate-selective porin [Gammaproteobacteria bacterium]|nr:OprO/OprP family phosphate-selective porin [Gammaproteobacteria bacterium]
MQKRLTPRFLVAIFLLVPVVVFADAETFTFKPGGRLMFDVASYSEDRNSLDDDHELRRIRLEAEGVLFSNWEYDFSVEFAGKGSEIKDAWLAYDPTTGSRLILGQYREPFGLEELTSSNRITFMERALPGEFAPGRKLGAGFRHSTGRWTAAAGVFGESHEDYTNDDDDGRWDVTGRVTYALPLNTEGILHLGLALSRHDTGSAGEVKYSARPESHLSIIKYANTGKIKNTQAVWLYGTELLAIRNNLSFQAEYVQANLQRDGGNDDLNFQGWYGYASWVVTGESRAYKARKAAPGRIKPKHQWGAWELALRYSQLDLNDTHAVSGGREQNVTLGLNWYINRHARLMLNHVRVSNDRLADDDGDVLGSDKPHITQARLQFTF